MNRQLKVGCLVVAGILAAIVIALVVMGRATNRKVAVDTEALGSPVIAALDRFKAAKKEYPRVLDELVPDYLPAVPLCRLDDARPRLAYRVDASSGGYELACPASALMTYRYRSATGKWGSSD